jgi:CheY-like chemotaxis protein
VEEPGQKLGTILVVDDEPMIRNMSAAMLNHFGWDTIAAADGRQALDLFAEKQDKIRCVLLDLTMPGMSGWEILQAMRHIRPNVPVILVSGYDEARVMEDAQSELPQAFLHKPYQRADLQSALTRAIAGS